MQLDAKIEALLFWKGEPIKLKKIADIFNVNIEEIRNALESLQTKLEDRGVTLVRLEDEVSLGTAKEMSSTIEKLTKDELVRDLGKAGLETLTIILYKGPIKRSEIDYIRGVNSQFIIRNLLIRGLIDRIPHPGDERTFLYKPTFDLLSHLGISKIEDLPEFESMKNTIDKNLSENLNESDEINT